MPHVANKVKGNTGGKRIIILHAMTSNGMLEVEGVEPSNQLDEQYESCALIFDEVLVDGVTPADYHTTITGDKFVNWMRNRLLPTFAAKFRRKKMILVLDNAKYHHHRGEDWISPAKMKRGELARFLRENRVPSITCKDGRQVKADKFSADVRGTAGGGPTLRDLRSAVKTYLLSHPGINTTVPYQLMSDAGHELLYTPPYESWLQPIELVWAWAKQRVARQSHDKRTHHETAAQTRDALCSVTPALCAKMVAHTERLMSEWMQSADGGSLRRFEDLEALSRATKTEIEACQDLSVEDYDEVEEGEEDTENAEAEA